MIDNNFADKIIEFNRNLNFTGLLPDGYSVINPFKENPETFEVMSRFYHKYYNDHKERKFLIGINPSRHGAGVTGVPFTDTKRLGSVCEIPMTSVRTHEVSSVFMYDMIDEYGGAKRFFGDVYINSPFPLAIVRRSNANKWLNANYYDDNELFTMTEDFMIESLRKQIEFGIDTSEVFILGKKNAVFISKLNKRANIFKGLTILEHPRYIQQYKSKQKSIYIDKYIIALSSK